MGVMIKCDVCGKEYESDNLQKLVIANGDTVLVEGFFCDECIDDLIEHVKQKIEKHNQNNDNVKA